MKRHRTHLRLVLKITIIYFAINFVVALFSIDAATNMSTAYTIVIFFYICYLLWVLIDFIFDKINQRTHPSKQVSKVQNAEPINLDKHKESSTESAKPDKQKKNIVDSTTPGRRKKTTYRNIPTTQKRTTKSTDTQFEAPVKKPVDAGSITKPEHKAASQKSSELVIHHLRRNLYNFVVVDIETTGLSSDSKIIQLSAIRYEHDKPVANYNKYINPGNLPLPAKITAITGITSEQLINAPSFSDVDKSFIDFVGTLPWVGHNINRFDIPHLVRNGLSMSKFSTLDTLKLARKKLNLDHYGLEYLKHYYSIHNGSHNAIEDCKTNAIVYQRLRDDELSPVQPDNSKEHNGLDGLTFVITGAFAGHSRSDIEEMITSHGGIVRTSVSHRTDYLVDGTQISESLTDGIHSSKELKAKEYGTEILDLDKLNQLISTKE